MANIIKNRGVVADDWTLLRLEPGESAGEIALAEGKVIVPFTVWQQRREELLKRTAIGVWLADTEGPELIASDLKHFHLIAIDFPKFANGRGYSTATLLRTRYGYQGELRAIGEVLRDQVFYLSRVGFDAFAIRPDRSVDDALNAFGDFGVRYQTSPDEALPLFRRVART